jgi:hypothetical protein
MRRPFRQPGGGLTTAFAFADNTFNKRFLLFVRQRTRFQLRRPRDSEGGVCCKPELAGPFASGIQVLRVHPPPSQELLDGMTSGLGVIGTLGIEPDEALLGGVQEQKVVAVVMVGNHEGGMWKVTKEFRGDVLAYLGPLRERENAEVGASSIEIRPEVYPVEVA